jgi:ribose transport system ATP-binding protein
MKQEPLLSLKGITKIFPGVKALDSVDFDLMPGQVHALVGENGAGKSTLIKIISGAYKLDNGDILIEGNKLNISSPEDGFKLGISTIYQEFNLAPHLSVAENLFMGKGKPINTFRKIKWSELYKNAIKLLKQFEIDIDPREIVKNLSVAKQRLVEIAKALVADAQILIMDEPTACLTKNEVAILFNVIRVLKNKGISIIYISHYLEEVFEVCDNVTVLRDGKKVGDFLVKDVSMNELVTLMIGKDIIENRKDNKKEKKIEDKEVLYLKDLKGKSMNYPVDFSLYKGEILGLAGLLGSGRSEILNTIFGADLDISGDIIVNGERKKINNSKDAIKAGIGMLTEDRKGTGLALELNIKENISLASLDLISSNCIIDHKYEKKKVNQLITHLNIKPPVFDKRVQFLSGGNQQKVVFAKWLCRNCQILLLDEPNKGIDIGAKQEVFNLIRSFVQEGNSVIVVSSELSELVELCNRVLILKEGKIVKEIKGENISQKTILNNLVS